MPFLHLLGRFGFSVGAALVAMAVYPIIARAYKPLEERPTNKKASPKGQKKQTDPKNKEKE